MKGIQIRSSRRIWKQKTRQNKWASPQTRKIWFFRVYFVCSSSICDDWVEFVITDVILIIGLKRNILLLKDAELDMNVNYVMRVLLFTSDIRKNITLEDLCSTIHESISDQSPCKSLYLNAIQSVLNVREFGVVWFSRTTERVRTSLRRKSPAWESKSTWELFFATFSFVVSTLKLYAFFLLALFLELFSMYIDDRSLQDRPLDHRRHPSFSYSFLLQHPLWANESFEGSSWVWNDSGASILLVSFFPSIVMPACTTTPWNRYGLHDCAHL